jgi:putative transposase
MVRSGCAWRLLPHEFPPWKTIHHYFRTWRLE